MSDKEHHPSCSPHDRDLVWHCNQCGLNESAADIEQQLDTEREHSSTIAKLADDQVASFNATIAAEREKVATLAEALKEIGGGKHLSLASAKIARDALAKVAK